jgi:hypothetical protein
MADKTKDVPDFFEENPLDPVDSATGNGFGGRRKFQRKSGGPPKQKAGFYLSKAVLERFNRKYYELKLAGISVENKSTLLEIALNYALDDIDKGHQSHVLKNL